MRTGLGFVALSAAFFVSACSNGGQPQGAAVSSASGQSAPVSQSAPPSTATSDDVVYAGKASITEGTCFSSFEPKFTVAGDTISMLGGRVSGTLKPDGSFTATGNTGLGFNASTTLVTGQIVGATLTATEVSTSNAAQGRSPRCTYSITAARQ